MDCPTCRSPMIVPGVVGAHLCRVCGTLVADGRVHVPRLVELCRKYEAEMGPRREGLWTVLGIRAAIGGPGLAQGDNDRGASSVR